MKTSKLLLSALLTLTATLLLSFSCSDARQNTYYTQRVDFPEGVSDEERLEMAARLIPSPKQEAWQQLELTAFLHFGINTFTDREWGDGTEHPALFRPDSLDTDQWVRTLREAGFGMVILTCKHHDGFCLWQTETTDFSVASSPWRDGKGDVLADLAQSCERYGMKLGVYLSPWDRHDPSYGTGDAYNDLYIAQLTELLTNYGPIDEVWFDGANGEGPNGKVQEYDWQRIFDTIDRLQPQAVTAIMGRDVRWCGNEKGLGRETEWSATVLPPGSYPESAAVTAELGISPTAADLGSREMLSRAKSLYWYPSEVDVSIRPGWFWHAGEEPKSLRELTDIYLQSVGRNSVLLLNIPPMPAGLLDARDVRQVRELGDWIRELYAGPVATKDLAHEIRVGEGVEVETDSTLEVGVVALKEDISRGQRVERFHLEGLTASGEWQQIADGTTIGYKRLLRLDRPGRFRRLRLVIDEGRTQSVFLRHIWAFQLPEMGGESVGEGDKEHFLSREGRRIVPGEVLELQFDPSVELTGFVYSPSAERTAEMLPTHYRLEASTDGETWEEIAGGEFANIIHNPIPQRVTLDRTHRVTALRLIGFSADGSRLLLGDEEVELF